MGSCSPQSSSNSGCSSSLNSLHARISPSSLSLSSSLYYVTPIFSCCVVLPFALSTTIFGLSTTCELRLSSSVRPNLLIMLPGWSSSLLSSITYSFSVHIIWWSPSLSALGRVGKNVVDFYTSMTPPKGIWDFKLVLSFSSKMTSSASDSDLFSCSGVFFDTTAIAASSSRFFSD